MTQFPCPFLLFLLLASRLSHASIEYTSDSGRTVIVTNEPFPGTQSNLSNVKCIEFTSGPPRDYTEACVTSIFSGNDKFEGCKVSFDGTECNDCVLCTDSTNSSIVGIELDCNNKLPAKNILSDCLAYNDAGIQQILDEGYFTEQFDFDAAAPESTPVAEGGESTGSSDAKCWSMAFGFASAMVFAVLHL